MARMLLIARNTIRAILSRAALYVWGFGTLLMFLRAGQAIFMKSDNDVLLRSIRANSIGGAMEAWSFGCILAAMVLGGTMVAGDMMSKRAVTVLARPIRRWEFLVGKVAGVWAFLAMTLPIGVGVGLGVAAYLGIAINTDVLPYAFAQTLVALALFTGVSAVVGSSGSAVAGFAICFMLVVLPGYVRAMHEKPEPNPATGVTADPPSPTQAAIGRSLDALLPEVYRPYFTQVTSVRPPSAPPRRDGRAAPQQRPVVADDEHTMLAGNLAYAGVYLLLGCLVFSRRDLSLH